MNDDRTMSRPRRAPAWAIAASLSLALAASGGASCAAPVDGTIVLGGIADAALPPQTFTPAEGGSDASVDVRPPVPMCIATQCPLPFATCSTPDDLGQKCGHDLSIENDNCGACGVVCPQFQLINLFSRCANGTCEAQCLAPRADCDKILEDGCEVDLSNDAKNCGSCGNACPAGVACRSGACGCPAGQAECSGSCVDLTTSSDNCGVCGHVCDDSDAGPPPPHQEYACVSGLCGQLRCSEPWKDCNGLAADGCEVNVQQEISPRLLDPEHCGSCTNKCAPGVSCYVFLGGAIGCGCKPNETLCGEAPYVVCHDLEVSLDNCGACGHACPYFYPPRGHQDATCEKGLCGTSCQPGWGDCNGNPGDGCETSLATSAANCGACGNRCDAAAGQPCIAGACLVEPCTDDGGTTK